MKQVTVVCMKWGTYYGPEYVNRLHAGVHAHLSRPFRFVCFTDDATGLVPDVEARPLPDTGSPETADTRWRKLALFRPDLDLSGTVLFLDLDLVSLGQPPECLRIGHGLEFHEETHGAASFSGTETLEDLLGR